MEPQNERGLGAKVPKRILLILYQRGTSFLGDYRPLPFGKPHPVATGRQKPHSLRRSGASPSSFWVLCQNVKALVSISSLRCGIPPQCLDILFLPKSLYARGERNLLFLERVNIKIKFNKPSIYKGYRVFYWLNRLNCSVKYI